MLQPEHLKNGKISLFNTLKEWQKLIYPHSQRISGQTRLTTQAIKKWFCLGV
ncbi:MAG: hypothetical protein Rpha_1627 [Candidatus Ruthia sp. Apha_13_S6]|nr:hypothetical protein [Candidatus Ruthia sp. Apha_13_S6]